MSMVDITAKPHIYRESKARGKIKLRPETIRLIKDEKIEKGNPLDVAKVAGILAAKNTSSLIPLCHSLPLTTVEVDLQILDDFTVEVQTTVKTRSQTGVEMEALVAASVALLTVWDMTKQYEKDKSGQYPHTIIQSICVIQKVKEEGK